MMNPSLFLALFCLIQISKLGFSFEEKVQRHEFVSVTNFGAVGDGKRDDSQAFLKAWEAVCQGGSSNTKLLVPQGRTFMLKPLAFVGPCKSSSISFSIRGNLVAPSYTWYVGRYPTWISFDSISGLVVSGGGTIDGRGSLWWGKVSTRPSAMHFNGCNGLRMYNLRHLNSPRNHISLSCSKDIHVWGLRLIAPGDSPNTDGIDISNSIGVDISDCIISTGDDCIAINGGSSFINMTRIFCGPGHGISVGSLGENGEYATVEEVRVKNSTFTNTQNGVRIKTFQNGSGYARKISFEDINMIASGNPIIIDQNYHDASKNGRVSSNQNCHLTQSFGEPWSKSLNGKGVKVSDVRYTRIHGTSASDQAITMNCDAELGCADIVMDHVNLVSATSGHQVFASCNNAHGSYVSSQGSCLTTG
ncbi:hypothetical protein AALP_AA1G286400 [Arabis alpina]|uniref:Polygalacturonase n=1 Tax=Arabis alpina TaxID=50452 RepID=A0A087HRA0_ARAAL|nr:hypothetical protein AALP_AA1G286400 [Arabis alpina]